MKKFIKSNTEKDQWNKHRDIANKWLQTVRKLPRTTVCERTIRDAVSDATRELFNNYGAVRWIQEQMAVYESYIHMPTFPQERRDAAAVIVEYYTQILQDCGVEGLKVVEPVKNEPKPTCFHSRVVHKITGDSVFVRCQGCDTVAIVPLRGENGDMFTSDLVLYNLNNHPVKKGA